MVATIGAVRWPPGGSMDATDLVHQAPGERGRDFVGVGFRREAEVLRVVLDGDLDVECQRDVVGRQRLAGAAPRRW